MEYNSTEIAALLIVIAVLTRIDLVFVGIYYVLRFLGLTKL